LSLLRTYGSQVDKDFTPDVFVGKNLSYQSEWF